jgi:hypothetical protein
MTEPINRKTEARKPTNPEGSAECEKATPTPQQRAVLERFLKLKGSRSDAPRLSVESKPDQPLEVMQVDDAGRPVGNAGLALAFGTTEAAVVSILLNSLINAACDGGHPPSEQDINGVLAAVHGIRANDEIEAMLAVQMVATHFAATRAAPFEGVGHGIPAGQQRKSRCETSANLRGPDRGIAALSRERAAESYRRARARPYRRAGNRWLAEPIWRGEGQ